MGKPHLRCNGLNASCSRGYVSPARTLFLLRSPLLFQLFLPSLARSSTTFRSATIFLFLSRFCLFFLSFSFFPRSDTNQNPPFNPIRPRRVAAARVMIRKNVERRACFSKGKKRGGKKWKIRNFARFAKFRVFLVSGMCVRSPISSVSIYLFLS